jgi:hypothetical protein
MTAVRQELASSAQTTPPPKVVGCHNRSKQKRASRRSFFPYAMVLGLQAFVYLGKIMSIDDDHFESVAVYFSSSRAADILVRDLVEELC